MATVFLSHAFLDKPLVDEFVATILKNGCGLSTAQIFYSSGPSTGVPDGDNLLAYVQAQVTDAGLVIAMLTPTFQTRPVCVAEMGAAWGTVGALFPLLVPGMDRANLEGVLEGMLINSMNNEEALDRLFEKLKDVADDTPKVSEWNHYKKKWIEWINKHVSEDKIVKPSIVTPEAHCALQAKHDELEIALSEALTKADRFKAERDAIHAAKTAEEITDAMLPDGDIERFELLVNQACTKLNKLHPLVARAIVAAQSSQGGLSLSAVDDYEQGEVRDLEHNGVLTTSDDFTFHVNEDFTEHENAIDAVAAALKAGASTAEESEAFNEWFRTEYKASPNFSNYTILKTVFLD